MKYKPIHEYEMKPVPPVRKASPVKEVPVMKSKADRLRELKQLLDEKLINQSDYEVQKKRILEEKE